MHGFKVPDVHLLRSSTAAFTIYGGGAIATAVWIAHTGIFARIFTRPQGSTYGGLTKRNPPGGFFLQLKFRV
jgi:hypothetical protein